MVAVLPGEVEEHIFSGHAWAESPNKVISDCFGHLKPGLARGQRADQVRVTYPPRGAIERAGRAGVRIATDDDLTRQRITIFRKDSVPDPLVLSYVMETLDAELIDELPPVGLPFRVLLIRCGNVVVVNDDDLLRVVYTQHLLAHRGMERRVKQHRDVNVHDDEIPGADPIEPSRPRQDLLGDRHSH